MTLQQIIYNIKDSLGSDAEELTNSQYKFIIDYYRSKLIRQRIQKGESISTSFIQFLNNIDVSEVSDEDPNCAALDCATVKSVLPIPLIIPYSFDTTLIYVGSTDGHLGFQETAFQALGFEMFAKYVKNQPKWFLSGDYIYITNPPDEDIDSITIQGVFEDPLAAASICKNFNTSCIRDYNFEYPISGDMLDIIYKLIRDNELKGLLEEIDEDETIAR